MFESASNSSYELRQRMIDYVSPETTLFSCEYGLLFGSRHAQRPLVGKAIELFGKRNFEKLIVCGGAMHGSGKPEAIEIAEQLIAAGFPAARIITECSSRNTGENVAFARKLLKDDVRELFLLGKIYAKRRYAMTVRARWPEIESISCYGMNYFAVRRDRWWQDQVLRRYVVAELRKIPRYIELGEIREIVVRDGRIV